MIVSLLASLVFAKHGALMLVGGTQVTPEILKTLGELSGGKDTSIVILGQAMAKPNEALKWKVQLNDSGFGHVFLEALDRFTDEDRKKLEGRLDQSSAVWVPDGDAALFIKRFGLAWCHKVFTKFIERGGTWCGFNAGAALAGDPMFEGETSVAGIGLIDAVVDYDYYDKHRELRLRNAYFGCRAQLGIGLNPGEWMVIRDTVIEKKVGQPQVFLRESG